MAEDYRPVRLSSDAPALEQRVPLFYLDDEEFTVPDPIPARWAVQAVRELAAGHDFVTVEAKLVERVIGPEAMRALAECESLTKEDLDQIMKVVKARTTAAVRQAQGK